MGRPELLAPAGDLNTLKVAIEAGADAVYIGGKSFSARYFATNFNDEDLIEAVKFAHERLKKVYVTINTIINDDEFKELDNYLNFLYSINVDAIIVQDLGVVSYVRKNYPNIEVHASTQMNVYSVNAIKKLKDVGITRVVLAREVSYDVIKELNKCGLELEVFIHGALCFSYSGNCLMSYSIGSRSGNKGKCAQPCRKTYSLYENDLKISKEKALLSMKDLCTIDNIDKLIDLGISSFKIEGRMKSSEYVYTVVKAYKKAIDNYYNNIYNKESDIKDMQIMFNRKFTSGYLFNETNNNITNIDTVNHQGIYLGKVVKVNNNSIEIALEEDLIVQDAIRINADEELGFNVQIMFVDGIKREYAKANEIVKIPLNTRIKVLNKDVVLTKSERIRQEVKSYMQTEHIKSPLNLNLKIKLNEKVCLTGTDGIHEISVYSEDVITNIIENPKNDDFYIDKLDKFVDTPFYLNNVIIDNDNKAFISIKQLNELRRNLIESLLKTRIKTNKIGKNYLEKRYEKKAKLPLTYEVVVHNRDQYDACIELGITNIYTDFKSNLMNISRLDPKIHDNHLVHNIGQIGKNVTISPYFNLINKESIKYIAQFNPNKIYLSYETELDNLNYIKDLLLNIGMPIYGKMDVMITKHCMIAKTKGFKTKHCNSCLNSNYYLTDEYNNRFGIITEPANDCNIRIIDYKTFNIINKLDYLKSCGINLFLLTFTTESKEEVKKILSQVI